MTTETKPKNETTLAQASITFGGVLLIMIVGIASSDTELHILLIGALLWACINGAFSGKSFQEIRSYMNSGIAKALSAMYMFILIGIVIAALIESGTILTIIYYSVDYVSPAWLLPAGLLFTSFMAVATGTSWGTVGTIGVVFVGLGSIIGIPLPIVAGMVVSGALFGDKMSPVSDTTILAAACAETDLYAHIRSMAYTTGPAYVIALLLFSFIGMQYNGAVPASGEIDQITTTLASIFDVQPLVLVPIVVLLILSFRGISAEPTMIAASIVAILIAAGLQDRTFAEIFNSIQYGYSGESGVAAIDTLLNRGGIQSMMWTMSLAFIALALGGVLDGLGVMHTLTRRLIGGIKSTMQLVGSTIATGIVTNMSMGENYLTIIFTSHIFKESFHKMGYQRRMLSRSVEEGATLTAGLIPWTTTGAFFSAALGVSTAQYAPWVLLSLINIPLSLLMAAVGIAIFRRADSVQIKENKRLPVDAQES